MNEVTEKPDTATSIVMKNGSTLTVGVPFKQFSDAFREAVEDNSEFIDCSELVEECLTILAIDSIMFVVGGAPTSDVTPRLHRLS